jgi:four helix bundle protein
MGEDNGQQRSKLEHFRQLKVWQKAHAFVLEIYRMTQGFPNEEKFGLVSQMRRAAVSVPANVAEGFKRRSKKEKAHFYNIAQASLEEMKYYLVLSRDLGFGFNFDDAWSRAEEIGKMLGGLIGSLEA